MSPASTASGVGVATVASDGTVLDNSMIVYGAGISDGDRHNHDNLPILLAGGGAGTLKQGRHVRVVSMPSWELFEHQSPEYRESVIPANVTARVGVEQASTFGWNQYVGITGHIIQPGDRSK